MKNNSLNEDNQIFNRVCNLLNQNKINFWVCHGTLLGIIRENRLLPWDHDIDFAVWDHEISKDKIIKLFLKNGFEQEFVFGDLDCLHFYGANKKIDISFYKVNKDIASIKWAAPPKFLIHKLYVYFVQTIWQKSFSSIELSDHKVKKIFQIIFILLAFIIRFLLTRNTKLKLYKHALKFINYTGYSYPIDLMVFDKIKFNDLLVTIPKNPRRHLEITYGPNWEVAKKEYIWYEEATNLKNLT